MVTYKRLYTILNANIANLSCGKWGQDDCKRASWSYRRKKYKTLIYIYIYTNSRDVQDNYYRYK